MAVAIPAAEVRDLFARIGEHDLGAPPDIEVALGWLDPDAGESPGEAPVVISRRQLQLFLWYVLPRKFAISLEEKRVLAARLGHFLELAGGRAGEYAAQCTSAETAEMLAAWEAEEPDAADRLQSLLAASGLEPPDTPLLSWGLLSGLEEARIHAEVAAGLERAIEAGELTPGERGFKREQAELTVALLRRPSRDAAEAGEAVDAVDLIREERIEHWARRRSDQRRRLLSAALPLLQEMVERDGQDDRVDDGSASAGQPPLEPLRWLLERAREQPLALTQTGALNRALVRASVLRFSEWWNSELHGPPNREFEVRALEAIHGLARRTRLLRRRGRALHLTKLGRELAADPAALAERCARGLFEGQDFECELGELQVAYLLPREGPVDAAAMDVAVQTAMVADGWSGALGPLEARDVRGGAEGPLAVMNALGLTERTFEFDRETLASTSELLVLPGGRELLRRALWLRATAPLRSP